MQHMRTRPPAFLWFLLLSRNFKFAGELLFVMQNTALTFHVVLLSCIVRGPPPAVYFPPLALATPPSSGLTLKVLYAGEVCARPRRPFTTPVMGAVPQAWLMVPDVKACGKKRKKSARRKKRGV